MSNPVRRMLGLESRNTDPVEAFTRGLDIFASSRTAAGKTVSTDSAMQLSSVYGCIRILSEGVATFPMNAHIRGRSGVRQPFTRPAWMNFSEGPYDRIDVIGQMMVSLLTDGNAYVATFRDQSGAVTWMRVLDPDMVEPVFNPDNLNQVVYKVKMQDHSIKTFDDSAIMHIRGMTLPGKLVGVSPIQAQRETIALGLAAQDFGAAFFGNGALPGMIATMPGSLSPASVDAMKRSWNDVHQGAQNSNRLAVFTEGATMTKVTVPPNDAQFLETRGFQVNDIARIYGVPTNLLQHSDGLEQGQTLSDKNTHFVQHSLRPWVERVEASLSRLMWTEGAPQQSFVKFNLDSLQRGDFQARHQVYNAAITTGMYTINEARAFEDKPPVEWGDKPISVQVQDDFDDTQTDSDTDTAPMEA